MVDNDEGVNAAVTYEALYIPKDPATQNELFTLNPSTGEIRTVSGTAGMLDREETDSYEMVVRVRDRGNPSLTCGYWLMMGSLLLLVVLSEASVCCYAIFPVLSSIKPNHLDKCW